VRNHARRRVPRDGRLVDLGHAEEILAMIAEFSVSWTRRERGCIPEGWVAA